MFLITSTLSFFSIYYKHGVIYALPARHEVVVVIFVAAVDDDDDDDEL